MSGYSLYNDLFNTTTKFTVVNFDNATLVASPAEGSNLYVTSITINGQLSESLCWILFEDVVGGGEITIELGSDAQAAASIGCVNE